MGLGDLTRLLGQFKDIQGNMARMQEELGLKEIEASSGGGMVTAVVNGRGDLLSVKIEPSAVDPGEVEMLEDLIKAAINAAVDKSREEMKQEMSKMTGGLNLPGLDQLGSILG